MGKSLIIKGADFSENGFPFFDSIKPFGFGFSGVKTNGYKKRISILSPKYPNSPTIEYTDATQDYYTKQELEDAGIFRDYSYIPVRNITNVKMVFKSGVQGMFLQMNSSIEILNTPSYEISFNDAINNNAAYLLIIITHSPEVMEEFLPDLSSLVSSFEITTTDGVYTYTNGEFVKI